MIVQILNLRMTNPLLNNLLKTNFGVARLLDSVYELTIHFRLFQFFY